MYKQEKIKPYNDKDDKGKQVEEMFDNIAHSYDKLNHRLSWNIDKGWRMKAIETLAPYNPKTILDVATGTGDFAILAAKKLCPQKLVGSDISEGMMEIGRQKVKAERLDGIISFAKEDCMALSFADNTFDALTVAYGIRNFADISRGLSEMARVLSPDGTLCILELSEPANPVLRTLYRFYSHNIIPMVGRMVSGDKSAYSYLPQSVAACPQRDGMTRLMTEAGFHDCLWKSLTFGAATIYLGKKRL